MIEGQAYDHDIRCTGCDERLSLPASPVFDQVARQLANAFTEQHKACADTPLGKLMRFPFVCGYRTELKQCV